MKITVTWYNKETGEEIDRIETTLARYIDENANAPPQYVIRQEIRDIGSYVTETRGIRTEVTKLSPARRVAEPARRPRA